MSPPYRIPYRLLLPRIPSLLTGQRRSLGRDLEVLFATIDNLLNTDNLTVYSYSPNNAITAGSPQLDSERRFGRRIELGFQVNF